MFLFLCLSFFLSQPNFEGTSLRQLITFGETDLVQRGLTTGAARKLRKYLDEMDFSGTGDKEAESVVFSLIVYPIEYVFSEL